MSAVDTTTESTSPSRIDIGEKPVVVGRSSNASLRLLHPTISRQHATIQRDLNGLVVTDHDSSFGTFINDVLVRTGRASIGDRIRFGTHLVYRADAAGLQLDVASQGLALVGTHIDISRHGRPLVQDAHFAVAADSFVGILGPSGAGKSTLLNCIGGYLIPTSGILRFDGRDAFENLAEFQELLGYVTQDDVVFSPLTVRENLLFSARLRVGSATNSPAVVGAVDRAIEGVELMQHAEARVSRLSGGQRKRLSVAIELLKRPRLLLLDEPTSGLDPASEANIMEQLRHLARQGTTVLCTTHMMENVRLFDEVIALGVADRVGRVAYRGRPDNLLPQFGCRTFADLYERLEHGKFEPSKPPDEPQTATKFQRKVISSSGPNAAVCGRQAETQQRFIWQSTHRAATQIMGSPAWLQVALLSWRSATLVGRDPLLLATMVFQPIVLGALVSLTQFRANADKSVLFFAVIIAIWLGMNNSIRDFVRERRHYLRDRLAGLRPEAYFGSKAVLYGGIGIAQITLLLIVLAVGCNLVLSELAAPDLAHLSTGWLSFVLLLSYFGGLAVGLTVSTLVRTEAAAVAALPLLIMPQLLLSAVAVGRADESYTKPRPFRPLVLTLADSKTAPEESAARLVDAVSMFSFSRPAVLMAESPNIDGHSALTWLADALHLLVLLFFSWTAAFLLFLRSERRWLRLLDLD